MKKILQYSKHFLAAKGRHGTHSPFVYRFVEEVLRNTKKFNYQGNTGILCRKEMNLLARTVRYISPSAIVADAALAGTLKDVISALGGDNISLSILDRNSLSGMEAEQDVLLISTNRDSETRDLLRSSLQGRSVYVLLLRPHADAVAEDNWYALSSVKEVQMRLDLWHCCLLVHDPAFKASQYFRLR